MYTSWQIALGALIGTPIGGGWLLSANYKTMGQQKKAKRAFLIGCLITAVFLFLFWLISAYLPLLLLPLFAGGIYHIIAEVKQGEAIKSHRNATNTAASWIIPIALGMVGIPILVSGMIWLPQLNKNSNSGTLFIGTLKHELHFKDVSPNEAHNIGSLLTKENHFGNDFKTFVELTKTNEAFTLYLPAYTTNWNDTSFHNYLSDLHNAINSDTVNINIVLFDGEGSSRKEKAFRP